MHNILLIIECTQGLLWLQWRPWQFTTAKTHTTEGAVAWATWFSTVVWDGKMKQGRYRKRRWVERQILYSCTVSPRLTPARQLKEGCMVYRSPTSVCSARRRRKWLLMQSRSHLHPVVHLCWAQNMMLHHSLSLLQHFKMLRAQWNKVLPSLTLFFFCFTGAKQ